ncbi:meiotic cell cortex C-terminal pleckstrin homology-domain-containing protein [Aspergillus cavernicola]|uniref:Meiotic cell cortex C-terminal pleckstrin homology-domain-containing protein n=1 Tax=Aspergillus cavernicola TaxID=176166 RepID=A0ABR4IA70_9EURO
MATEAIFQSSPAASAFPTPSTTPKRPPSMHARTDSSPGPTSSPVSLPNHISSPGERSDFDDVIDEDVISPLDPRRFTPTLHASLVSEILALRRDVESKTKSIDVLERTLDDSRIENEELTERLSKHSKESRSLKHQLQLLEGGSSSALGELAKERDNALEGLSEIRRKFDQAQKKVRNREDELERTTKIWTRDREAWDGERRNLERKVHVVEGRLKVVLNEVAAQAAGSLEPASNCDGADAMRDAFTGKDSDSASIHSSSQGRRRTSVTSMSSDDAGEDGFHNARYSVMSAANIPGSQTNLAQELAFDEEDEFDLDHDMAPQSPEELPEERPASVHSQLSHRGMDTKARKILGLSFNSSLDGYVMRAEETAELRHSLEIPSVEYQDTGVQYSPPPSPTLSPTAEANENDVKPLYEARDSCTSTLTIDMASSSSQTVDDLPTPPWTPRIEVTPEPPVVEGAAMVSASVQTDTPAEPEEPKSVKNDVKSANIEIPMITIHPPQSEPPSPRGSVVLPPQTKSVSCQADFKPIMDSRTIGIQTEPIRVDQRPVKLPASLLPSAIPDLPLSTATQDHPIQPYQAPPLRAVKGERKPPPLVVEMPTDTKAPSKPKHVQAYPGNNDNGPLSGDSRAHLRRPLRSSSLFAGFEQTSDEESPDATKDVFTDDEFLNRPFASYKLRRGKLVSAHESRRSLDDTTLPEVDEDFDSESRFEAAINKLRSSPGSSGSRSGAPSTRQQDMRRAAMISSGAAIHQRRARSPSEPSIDSGSGSNASSVAPPFPVPIRLSSRKFPQTGSDGRQSPTPSRNFSDRPRPSIVRRPTLRRVRSAAAMSQTETDRPTTRSSPAMSISSYAPDSPQRPPMPFDDITMPRNRRSTQPGRRPSASQHLAHQRHGSTATTVQPTSVVDAIAQTMVGEWMWKYVRRRRSFGGDKDNWETRNPEEVSASITNSGVRHKRWVWLAPYERAVMWSSKQPTTGPALLGKSGRKLVIQSVLDVKDDNPLPKGFNGPAQFNRSILILTPQRALKFTATSIERHYVWLTALSFLSHSAMGVQDLAALPPIPQEEYVRPTPTASLRRNPIRDSIRIAKGRPRPFPKGKQRSFTNNHPEPVPELPTNLDVTTRVSDEAADPPTVPRFSNHSRKRSNTAPRMPIPNIRSFSSQNTMPSMRSSPDAVAPSMHSQGFNSVRSSISHRTSEASVRTGNFFDAIGTVRMEAFIDQTDSNRYRVPAARRHTRKASTPWSMNQPFPELDSPYESREPFRQDDPFRGF